VIANGAAPSLCQPLLDVVEHGVSGT